MEGEMCLALHKAVQRNAILFSMLAKFSHACLMRDNTSLRMASNFPVAPPLARLKGSESPRRRLLLRVVVASVPEYPAGGSSADASQTTLAGSGDTLHGGNECSMDCELDLAVPCWNTAPNSPIALPVRACPVVPCSDNVFMAASMFSLQCSVSEHVTVRVDSRER